MRFHHVIRRYLLSWVQGTPIEYVARTALQMIFFPKSAQYDTMTKKIIHQICSDNSNCVDIGAYRGDILRIFSEHCPHGQLFAFEPVPDNFQFLRCRYPKAHMFDIAVENRTDAAEFFVATGRPTRSGLSRRTYPDPKETVQNISVQIESLDNLIPENIVIDFIKIDVEGFELPVLNGAARLIRRHRPALLFEHGSINGQPINSVTSELYDLVSSEYGLNIWTLRQWLNSSPPLSRGQFLFQVSNQGESYFFAKHPT